MEGTEEERLLKKQTVVDVKSSPHTSSNNFRNSYSSIPTTTSPRGSFNRPKLHYPSLFCVMFLGFVANVEYGVIMPSVWEYIQSMGGSEDQLGLAISACSMAQLVFLPIFGYWSDKRSMREASCFAILIGVVGNFVYANAMLARSAWLIIVGRTFVGVYSGVTAVSNSYIAAVTTIEERTRFMAIINGVNAAGLVSGPGFNIFLSRIDIKIGHYIHVTPLTSPGWLIGVLLAASFFAYLILFREPIHVTEPEKHLQEPEKATKNTYITFLLESYKKPYIACFLVSFVQNFDFSVLETILTPLTKEHYKFGPFWNSVLYSGISVEMIIVIILAAIAAGRVSDNVILITGEVFMGAGLILIFFLLQSPPLWLFLLMVGVLIVGLPSQNTAIMGAYTKYLTIEYGPGKQGLYNGVMMVFGSAARILGPLWGGYMVSLRPMFALLIGMWILEVLLTFFFLVRVSDRYKPKPTETPDTTTQQHLSFTTSEKNPLLTTSQQ